MRYISDCYVRACFFWRRSAANYSSWWFLSWPHPCHSSRQLATHRSHHLAGACSCFNMSSPVYRILANRVPSTIVKRGPALQRSEHSKQCILCIKAGGGPWLSSISRYPVVLLLYVCWSCAPVRALTLYPLQSSAIQVRRYVHIDSSNKALM